MGQNRYLRKASKHIRRTRSILLLMSLIRIQSWRCRRLHWGANAFTANSFQALILSSNSQLVKTERHVLATSKKTLHITKMISSSTPLFWATLLILAHFGYLFWAGNATQSRRNCTSWQQYSYHLTHDYINVVLDSTIEPTLLFLAHFEHLLWARTATQPRGNTHEHCSPTIPALCQSTLTHRQFLLSTHRYLHNDNRFACLGHLWSLPWCHSDAPSSTQHAPSLNTSTYTCTFCSSSFFLYILLIVSQCRRGIFYQQAIVLFDQQPSCFFFSLFVW